MTHRQSRLLSWIAALPLSVWSKLFTWAVMTALFVAVSTLAWAGNSFTAAAVRDMVVLALPFAGIYAISASGLVVVYTTTGIFNFAQGAIGMFLAYVFWQMTNSTTGWGLPVWVCLPLVVLVIAPIVGIALDRAIMRRLQGKPLVVQLMVTVGLMFAFIALAGMIWNQNDSHSMQPLFDGAGRGSTELAGVLVTWPRIVVVVLGVLLVAGLRLLYVRLQERLVTFLVIAGGLIVAFGFVANTIWKDNAQGDGGGIKIGDILLTWHRSVVVILAIAIAIGMRFLLFSTRLGIAMRAVVDNRDLAALEGARASVLSSAAWAIGCSLAALAGILIAPETADMSTTVLTFLIITAFSAAVVGRLRSLPLTYLGALILALATQYVASFLEFSGRWSNITLALPTIMLLIVLLLLPRAGIEFGRISAVRRIERVSTLRDTALGMGLLLVFVFVVSGFMSGTNVSRFTLGMCTALVALSLVPLTGWAGQVSLAPMAFAAIGAVAYVRLPGAHLTLGVAGYDLHLRVPISSGSIWAVLLAALVTIPVGAMLAFPAMRLQGLYLALATLAFAAMVDQIFWAQPFAVGEGERTASRMHLFGFDFNSTRSLLLLVTVVFGLCGIGVVALRRSAFGRRLVALRDSEAASVTVGVNVLETKLAVFSLSAAMAGFAGAFFAMNFRTLSQPPNGFEMLTGLAIVLALVIGGVGFVAGALFAGIFGLVTVMIQENWHISLWLAIVYLAPGLAVLGIIQNPSGAVVPIGEGFARLLPWRKDAQQDYEELRAANAEPEIGVLGIERPFEEADVLLIDRALGVSNDIREPAVRGA